MATNPGTRIVTKIVFPVDDVAAAVAFYRGLGFAVEAYDDGYAWVNQATGPAAGDEVLHLARADDFDREANRAAGYLHVQDVDAWHGSWVDAGVDVSPLVDQPWGMREFTLRDPFANLLRVGQNLP